MVSQCANPGCGAQFLYFGEGKLVVVRRRAVARDQATVEFFWLCGDCAAHLNLEVPSGGMPIVVPLQPMQDPVAAH